jgi:hypothetical protein
MFNIEEAAPSSLEYSLVITLASSYRNCKHNAVLNFSCLSSIRNLECDFDHAAAALLTPRNMKRFRENRLHECSIILFLLDSSLIASS